MSSLADLRRSRTDRKLTGLCGGIADHWRIDPLLVRILTVLLVLSAGIGLVCYVFGSLLIRSEGATEPPIQRWLPTSKQWSPTVWVVLFVAACIAALVAFGATAPIGIVPAVVIAAVWFFGLRRPGSNRSSAAPGQVGDTVSGGSAELGPDPLAGPDTPFRVAARAWRERQWEYQRHHDQNPQAYAPSPARPTPDPRHAPPAPAPTFPSSAEPNGPAHLLAPTAPYGARGFAPSSPPPAGARFDPQAASDGAPPGIYTPTSPTSPATQARGRSTTLSPAQRRRRLASRRLLLATLVVTGLALAGLGVAQGLGVPVSTVAYLATALIVVGIGVIASAWVGRSGWLVTLGVLLLISTCVTAVASGPLRGQVGGLLQANEAEITFTTAAALPTAPVHYDVGTYRLDLSAVELTDDHRLDISLDIGSLTVVVPEGTQVHVSSAVDLGQIRVGRVQLGGADVSDQQTIGPNRGPTLTLVLKVDVGGITVVQA